MHLKKATGLVVELTYQSRGNDLTQLHRHEETWHLSGWDEPNHYLPCAEHQVIYPVCHHNATID